MKPHILRCSVLFLLVFSTLDGRPSKFRHQSFYQPPFKVILTGFGIIQFNGEDATLGFSDCDSLYILDDSTSRPCIVRTTRNISPTLGLAFGIKYEIIPRSKRTYKVEETRIYPGKGICGFETELKKRETHIRQLEGEYLMTHAYVFDLECEFAKGEWVFIIKVDGRTYIREIFDVTDFEQVAAGNVR